jgi:hypothetical protein
VLLVLASTAVAAHTFSAGHGFGGHMASVGHAFSGARSFSGRSFAAVRSAPGARFAPTGRNFSQSAFSGYPGVSRPTAVTGARTYRGATGTFGGRVGSWGGGYWRGSFWPRAYYRVGIPWFLPILPAAYLTFWWEGLPYYYWDDAYYLWSPADRGYVLTTPPPAAEDSAGPGAVDDLYAYPRNGQSDEQQAQDRRECEQWASSQGAGTDYRRAIAACLEGRDYSVR